ncbi:V-type ATP synthase subunit E [Limihaloglobus sulfuriphilus]|uniref:V-type proton ATPase subunit E n=1 Tax=Limihaloglobus sulfuriphilus TaxID=1851148 RepID=A0A1Q2MAP9_9BACT|nr:V-type ATP synthase subunit E [Limihaloglobus sulfuriphilus]AQQ69740.1 V-type ATP synthase subunit E [Limihaloglobus sulfuriphilus]
MTMDAEKIIKKILDEARAEAEKIMQENSKELESMKEKYAAQIEQYKSETEDIAEKRAAEKKRQMLASGRIDAARMILKAKRDGIDQVFSAALEELKNMDKDKYLEMIGSFVKAARPQGDCEMIIGKEEKRINEDFIKDINAQIESAKITLRDKKAGIAGGFILAKGGVRTNVSFEVLMQAAREKLEPKLAGELFS